MSEPIVDTEMAPVEEEEVLEADKIIVVSFPRLAQRRFLC